MVCYSARVESPTLKVMRSNRTGRTKGKPPILKGWRFFLICFLAVEYALLNTFEHFLTVIKQSKNQSEKPRLSAGPPLPDHQAAFLTMYS